MIILKKPGPKGELRIRTVFDRTALNANTRKVASHIETILNVVAGYRYRSLIAGRDAYEQIRVESKYVWKTLFNTPDGSMESLVMQEGDCNAPATYQTRMNHIVEPYIGVFFYVYLDDIIIFSRTVKVHVEHIRGCYANRSSTSLQRMLQFFGADNPRSRYRHIVSVVCHRQQIPLN